MKIHAIETGKVAIKEAQRTGEGSGLMRPLKTLLDSRWTEFLPIYTWVMEHPEGLIVVDTGEIARVHQPGYFPAWHPYFAHNVREAVEPEQEIGQQMRAQGLSPEDVRWVVLTHLHTDHAGGMYHFPQAEFLVTAAEFALAAGTLGKLRGYLPHRWFDGFAPRRITFAEDPFGPFPQSLPLTRADDVILVPTPGHTPGHLSVVVREGDHHLFLAGDTSYTQDLMLSETVDGVSPDERQARETLRKIKRYVQTHPTVYLPAHDPDAGRRLQHREIVPRLRVPDSSPRLPSALPDPSAPR